MWILYSVLAAISFGIRGICYHATSQLPVNRNVLLCGVFTMGAIVSLAAAFITGQAWTAPALVGVQMGLLSFAGNASMFKGFAVGKASLIAILTAMPPVVVVVFAYALWNEALNVYQGLAFAILVGGILLVRYSNDLSLSNLQGAQWGLLSLLMFAGNDLSGSWSTKLNAPLFPTLFYMFTAGSIAFGLWWLKDKRSEAAAKADKVRVAAVQGGITAEAGAIEAAAAGTAAAKAAPWSGRRTFLTGMLVGITNVVGMIFILTAFDYGKAGLVSAVSALNVLIVLLYTRFVVKEQFSRLEIVGMAGAFAGIVLLRLFGG